jgi:dephospho-CoA kinase
MHSIGITGGIGAGKTEILKYIRKHYLCEIYLADHVANEVKEPGHPCYDRLVQLLGKQILDKEGKIDRIAMAAKIFMNKELLDKVNALIHPAVREYLLEKMKQGKENPKLELLFIEAALLIETGYKDQVDEMWYIHADEHIRRARLLEERNYSHERVTQIMQQQLEEETFRKECDVVIENNGSLEDCYRQVNRRLEAFTWLE